MQRRSFVFGTAWAAMAGAAHAGGKLRKVKFTQPDFPAEARPFLPRVLGPAPGDRVLQMQPKVATSAGETHSVLAVSRQSFGHGDPYRFTGQMRTVQQLRTGSQPNAWEVAWLVWNYGDNDHLHYFVLKPNGWEIGKRDPRYRVPGVNDGQKVMATGDSVRLELGAWNHFDVRVAGAEAEIAIDGKFVTRLRDTDSAPLLAGRVGLYGEDAVCQWHDITAPVADRFAAETQQPLADGTQLTHWDIAFLGYGCGAIVTNA